MKKVLFVVALFAMVSSAVLGQTEKGKVFVAGSTELSLSSSNSKMQYDGETIIDDIKNSEFNLKPSVGYFVMDNLAVGLTVDVETSKESVGDSDPYKTSTAMFGPMVKYYFGTNNIKPYVQGDVVFGNYKESEGDDETKVKMSGWDLGGGVAIFLNEFVALDFGLGYVSATGTNSDDTKHKIKATGFGFFGGLSVVF